MDIQRPLFWHQGLFLQPQHFQLLELSSQSLLLPLYRFTAPHFWGVGKLDVQTSALANRSFSLVSGEFLFPDGSHVVVPDNAFVEARTFDEAWVEGGKVFTIYAGIKKWSDARENVTVIEKIENLSGVTTRFVTTADPEEVADLHAAGPKSQVKRLSYVMKVFWETERDGLGDYVLLPLAQLERFGTEIILSERYVPPCLTVSSAGGLLKIVREIRDQIAARGRQLEELKVQRGVQTAEFGSRDMVYLLALRSLNRYVPLLFHLTEAYEIHPWIVYGALRQLIGELSSFSEKVTVLGESVGGELILPVYDHTDLWRCFSTAQALIAQLLDEITAGPDYIIRLLYDGAYYAAALKPAIFEGRNRYYLVMKTETDPKFVLTSLGTVVKLSSREHLPILIARALPGIGLEHLPVPPQELPRRAHSIYLAVDHHSDQWALVEKGHNIAMYWDTAPDDLEVELMVVRR